MSRHDGRIVGLLKASALCLIVGCSPSAGERGQGPGPSLVLLDSMILEETDTLYLGRPAVSFTIDERGAVYIPDEFWNRVVRYHPDGRLDRTFGKAGSGPGEFRSLNDGTIVHDSLVVQPTSRRLVIFDRRTGRYYHERRTQGNVTQGTVNDGHLLLADFNYTARHALLRLPLADILTPDTAPLPVFLAANLTPWPPEYSMYSDLIGFNRVTFEVWGDTLLVGFAGVDYLVLQSVEGVSLDTIRIPARLRTGIPPGTYERLDGGKASFDEQVRAISVLKKMWRLSDGRFILWFQDSWAEPLGDDVTMFGRAFVTLLSADREVACVDTEVLFPGTEWPRIEVHGDTLFALDQVCTVEDSARVASVIRRYLIDDTGCEWVPTG